MDTIPCENHPQKEAWLTSFPEQNPHPILEISLSGCIEYINPALQNTFPTLLEEQLDHPFLVNWQAIVDQFQDQPDQIINREVIVGEERYHQSISFVKEYQRLRVFGINITSEKQLEAKIEEAERKYRKLVFHAPVGIYEVDFRTQKFLSINEAMCLYTGYSREEMMAMSPMDFLDEPSQQLFGHRIQKWLAGEQPEKNVEFRILAKDGHEIFAELDVTFTRDEQGRPLGATVIAHDITERKKVEEALIEATRIAEHNQLILDAVIQQMPAGVIISDATGIQARNNLEMDRIWRRTMQSNENIEDHDYQAFHPDGRKYRMEEWPLSRSLRQGEIVNGEEMTILRGDGTLGVLHVDSAPIRDKEGQVIAGVVVDVDITDLKHMQDQLREANEMLEQRVRERTAELERTAQELEKALQAEKLMRQRLIQSEKFAALSRLVASVAHEINNPLQTVQNSLYLLQNTQPTEEEQECLDMALSESRRISALVQQLRETYRPDKEPKAVDFNLIEVLHQVKNLLQPQLRQNEIELRMFFAQKTIQVHGITDQIKQVFLNLCLNAIDAIGFQGGKIMLDVQVLESEKQVYVSVQDTGPGIPQEDLERIFEPFYSTKVKGTGLGLAICYEILKDHQGMITVESELGKGAKFTVLLPMK